MSREASRWEQESDQQLPPPAAESSENLTEGKTTPLHISASLAAFWKGTEGHPRRPPEDTVPSATPRRAAPRDNAKGWDRGGGDGAMTTLHAPDLAARAELAGGGWGSVAED